MAHESGGGVPAQDCVPRPACQRGDRSRCLRPAGAERPAGVELLIRAAWDRCVSAPQRYVWATVQRTGLEHLS